MTGSFPTTLPAFFWHFIKKQPKFFLLAIIHLGWAVDWMLMPYLFKVFINSVIVYTGDRADAWAVLTKPVLSILAFWVLLEIFYRASDYLAARVYPQFEANIRMAMLDYIGGHSHRFFAEHLSGDIASKVDDIRESATRIMQLFLSLFIPSFVAILIATSLYTHFHPLFGLVVFTWSFLHLSICIFFAKKCNVASDLHSESKSHLNGQVVDGFANMSTVRLFSAT